MILSPTILFILRAGDDTERLVWHLQRELAAEAEIHAPELPPVLDTPIAIKFEDGRHRADAAQRIREVLDRARSDWPEFLVFAEPSEQPKR